MQARFWIKAFIPSSVYDSEGQEITYRLNDKDAKNTSVIPLQSYLPSLTPFYETDNRTFTDAPTPEDSARITTVIDIPNDEKEAVRSKCYSNPTRQIMKSMQAMFRYSQPMTNADIGFDYSATEHPVYQQKINARSTNHLNLSFATSGSNPFFYLGGMSLAPAIKMKFDLNIKLKDDGFLDISLEGKTTQFPAFEAYVQINDQVVPLFRREPKKGKTPFHLMYGATENIEIKTTVSSCRSRLFYSEIEQKSNIESSLFKILEAQGLNSEDRQEPSNPPIISIYK